MKQLFKLKYKLHKFVNIIFYLLIFLLGYVGGANSEKIFDIINDFFS